MVVDISDLSTDGSTGAGNNSGNSAGDSHDNSVEITLDPVFEEIGADKERVREFIREQDKADAITNLAKELAESDELFALLEEYRRFTDMKRIIQNHLYNYDDGEFSRFTGAFWGDSDDPEPDTFNYVQQKVRNDSPGNLYYYKQMFPEPVEEYWDGDAVLWEEKPDQDSHIYVTEEFATDYAGFTMEVDGREVPRPPTDSEVEAMSESSRDSSESASTNQDVPIDTTEVTVDELEEQVKDSLADLTREQLENLYDHEEANKDRKTAKAFLEQQIETVGHDNGADGSAESETSGDESPEARAGRLMGEHNLDVSPDFIRGIVKGNPDATDEEIVAMCE